MFLKIIDCNKIITNQQQSLYHEAYYVIMFVFYDVLIISAILDIV